jgi:osmoprotectant transport system permease protein
MREAQAQDLGVRSISDLARLRPDALKLAMSHEFLARADGWPSLQRAYGLPQSPGKALDHGLAYEALRGGQVDLIDVYSTDAKVGRYGLRVLIDDKAFFPRYDAVLLMRTSVDERPLLALAGRIDNKTMVALNAQVEIDGLSFAEVARRFIAGTPPAQVAGTASAAPTASTASTVASAARPGFVTRLLAPDLWPLLAQHLLLVFGSLLLAVLVAVPLGVLAWRRPRLAGLLLGAVGVLQTVPSLAMLAFLIALLGTIGLWPALLALFLYALLPIVRNTHAGLAGVAPGLTMAAQALGLNPSQTLRHRAAAAGHADAAGGCEDGSGHQRRHRDRGGVRRCRWPGRAHRRRALRSTTARPCWPVRCRPHCWRCWCSGPSTASSGTGGPGRTETRQSRQENLNP